jgi:polygalacturonase
MTNQNHRALLAFSVLDCGAIGDDQTLNTQAIQVAIEACYQASGGTIYFPSGNYFTGAIIID